MADNVIDLKKATTPAKRLPITPAGGNELYLEFAEYLFRNGGFDAPEHLLCSLIAQSYLNLKRLSKTVNKGDLSGLVFKGQGENGVYEQQSVHYQVFAKERAFILSALKQLKKEGAAKDTGAQQDPINQMRSRVKGA